VAGDFSVQGGATIGRSLQVNGNIGASGQALFQNSSNSTSAFQVQNASGGSLVNVDSTSSSISLLGNATGETGAWKSSANTLSSARWGTTNVTANGYLYIIGGYDGASYLSTVNYAKLNTDGSIGTIGSVNSLPAGAEYASSVFANGNIYVLGGFNGAATTNVYYAHVNSDGTLGSWATSATTFPIATGLYLHTSVTANGYVYMMGGYSSSGGNQNKVYYSKLNADGSLGARTTSGNNLTSAVQSAAAVTANGYVYVLGGSTTPLPTGNINSGYFAKLNMDGSISTWTAISLPINIGLESAVVNNGYVYLIGGENSAPAELSSVYFAKLNANGTIGGWTQSANSLFGGNTRWGTKAVSANGYIYEPAGNSGGAGTQTTYYVSTSRVQIGGNLDLVGLQGQTLADAGDSNTGSTGGSITAGNGTFVGSLQVQGSASFAQGLSVAGNFSVNNVLYADSTNMTITLGQPSATPVLLVLGTKNTSGDPACTNGAIYYNSNFNQLRACVNGTWTSFGNNDGWVFDADQTWTYASASSFTVSGDQTAAFTPGTRIKLTQSATVEYFVVTSSSYSSPNTTVNITGGSDYTLANSAISANFHSYQANPQGYPDWFNYSPAYSGWSANPTGTTKFSVTGRTCTVVVIQTTGTSNSLTTTMTLPIAPTSSGMDWFDRVNSVQLGLLENSGQTLNMYQDANGTNFAASGNKYARFTISYPF
jgi:hypothetical protein